MLNKTKYFVQGVALALAVAALSGVGFAAAGSMGGSGVGATATGGTASGTVRSANSRFRELLAKKVPKGSDAEAKLGTTLTGEMRGLFDVHDLVRKALVVGPIDHWAQMTTAQQDDLVETLSKLVERSYIKQLRTNLKYEVDYAGEEARGGDMYVRTTIHATRRGRPEDTQVDYLLHADGGTWRVYDVITDDVSMLDNYRTSFHRIIVREGVPGLLAKMHRKLTEDTD